MKEEPVRRGAGVEKAWQVGRMDGEDEDSVGPLAGNSMDSEPLELSHFPWLMLVIGLNTLSLNLLRAAQIKSKAYPVDLLLLGFVAVGFSSHALAVGQHGFQ